MKTPITYDDTWGLIYDAKGGEVAACHSNKQDAADIVRICNAHKDLVSVLGRMLRAHDAGEYVLREKFADAARAALIKARGIA